MTPQEPVVLEAELIRYGSFQKITFAKDQPPYIPLPVVKLVDDTGMVTSRWRLTWKERLRVLLTGNMFLSQLTFNSPLQPIKPTTTFGEIFE